jgi:Rieske 2Fe-2S family protein
VIGSDHDRGRAGASGGVAIAGLCEHERRTLMYLVGYRDLWVSLHVWALLHSGLLRPANRQDWTACESVQRGLTSPHFRPGPFAPSEDAVHRWVTVIAHAYLGTPPDGRA